MIMKRNNLDILFQQYYERLVLFAESYVGDMMIAEDIVQDIVQDVFLTILSRPDFADVGYAYAYFIEDREYFNSPSVYRGSTPKGGGGSFAVNLYISSKDYSCYKDDIFKIIVKD